MINNDNYNYHCYDSFQMAISLTLDTKLDGLDGINVSQKYTICDYSFTNFTKKIDCNGSSRDTDDLGGFCT